MDFDDDRRTSDDQDVELCTNEGGHYMESEGRYWVCAYCGLKERKDD